MYQLADMHCDTPFELFHKREKLFQNTCHIALDKAKCLDKYFQVFAIWSNHKLDDEAALCDFYKIYSYFENELSENGLRLSTSKNDIKASLDGTGRAFVLSLEDARIIRELETADKLFSLGVRIVTPLWQGNTVIGGSFDTFDGLTDHGKRVLERICTLGIIPDISHASHESAKDIIKIAEKHSIPVIASHSNAYGVFCHPRNISDDLLKEVILSGGKVGLSFAPQHICENRCNTDAVIAHIDYYLNTVGENSLCLGGDFDGIEKTPVRIENITKIPHFFDIVCSKFGNAVAQKIFFENAYNFCVNNIADK